MCIRDRDAKARQAKLRLDIAREALARDPAVLVAGQPDKSLVWQRISSSDPDTRMPPRDTNRQLTAAQRELIRRWIVQGAEFRGHWSLTPPVRRPPPRPKGEGPTPRNAVDAFIQARLRVAGLKMSAAANRRTLLRRLTFDLVGLPPTEYELEVFLSLIHISEPTRPY